MNGPDELTLDEALEEVRRAYDRVLDAQEDLSTANEKWRGRRCDFRRLEVRRCLGDLREAEHAYRMAVEAKHRAQASHFARVS